MAKYILKKDKMKNEIIERLKFFFKNYPKRKRIIYVILFGSFANNKQTPLSDIDLAVKMNGTLDDLALLGYDLEDIIDIDFELISLNYLRELDVVFAYEIFTKGKLIYYNDLNEYYNDLLIVINKFLDFNPIFLYYSGRIKDAFHRSSEKN